MVKINKVGLFLIPCRYPHHIHRWRKPNCPRVKPNIDFLVSMVNPRQRYYFHPIRSPLMKWKQRYQIQKSSIFLRMERIFRFLEYDYKKFPFFGRNANFGCNKRDNIFLSKSSHFLRRNNREDNWYLHYRS